MCRLHFGGAPLRRIVVPQNVVTSLPVAAVGASLGGLGPLAGRHTAGSSSPASLWDPGVMDEVQERHVVRYYSILHIFIQGDRGVRSVTWLHA